LSAIIATLSGSTYRVRLANHPKRFRGGKT